MGYIPGDFLEMQEIRVRGWSQAWGHSEI